MKLPQCLIILIDVITLSNTIISPLSVIYL